MDHGLLLQASNIVVDLWKIEAISKWPTIENVHEVNRSMCLEGYHHRFVEGFSKISKTITYLQKMEGKLNGPRSVSKHLIRSSSLVLKVPHMEQDFVVCNDASNEERVDILLQYG